MEGKKMALILSIECQVREKKTATYGASKSRQRNVFPCISAYLFNM